MEPTNKCERRVVLRYYCTGPHGCAYYTLVRPDCGNGYKARKGYCEYYNWRGGECMNHAAQTAADAAQALLGVAKGGTDAAAKVSN